jgi:hypothetical protein
MNANTIKTKGFERKHTLMNGLSDNLYDYKGYSTHEFSKEIFEDYSDCMYDLELHLISNANKEKNIYNNVPYNYFSKFDL